MTKSAPRGHLMVPRAPQHRRRCAFAPPRTDALDPAGRVMGPVDSPRRRAERAHDRQAGLERRDCGCDAHCRRCERATGAAAAACIDRANCCAAAQGAKGRTDRQARTASNCCAQRASSGRQFTPVLLLRRSSQQLGSRPQAVVTAPEPPKPEREVPATSARSPVAFPPVQAVGVAAASVPDMVPPTAIPQARPQTRCVPRPTSRPDPSAPLSGRQKPRQNVRPAAYPIGEFLAWRR